MTTHEDVQNEVWQHLFSAEKNCRYYETLYSRMLRRYVVVRFLTLTAIIGGVFAIPDVGVWGTYSNVAKGGIVALAALLTIWDAVTNYSKKAVIAQMVYFHYTTVRSEWRDLWLTVGQEAEDIDYNDIRMQITKLARRSNEIEIWAGLSDVAIDSKLNEKMGLDAKTVLEWRYPSSSGTT